MIVELSDFYFLIDQPKKKKTPITLTFKGVGEGSRRIIFNPG
jgi:hypothetical protein